MDEQELIDIMAGKAPAGEEAPQKVIQPEAETYLTVKPEDIEAVSSAFEPERPWLSKVIPRQKVMELAEKYGQPVKEIEDLIGMRGAIFESQFDEQRAKEFEDMNILQKAGTVAASAGESALRSILPGMSNSVLLEIPWKLRREAAENPQLFDEIERLATENKGYLQSGSELAVESFATGGIGAAALKSAGVTAKAAKAAESARKSVDALFGKPLIGKAAAGAIQLAPSAVLSGGIGAGVGYGAARNNELEAMRNYGAMFAAMPYAGVAVSKLAGAILAKPTSWVATKIGLGRERAMADMARYEAEVQRRAATEDNMLALARRKTNFTEMSDEQVEEMYRVLKKGAPSIKTISEELKEQNFKGNIDRRAKEIAVRTQLDRKLAEFADDFLPMRTAIDKGAYNLTDTINTYSQIDSLSEMTRYLRYNKFIDKDIKDRLTKEISSALKAGESIGEQDALLTKIKSSLTTEWLEPRLKAVMRDTAEELPGKIKFNSVEDVRNYIDEVFRTSGNDQAYLNTLWKSYRVASLTREGMKDVVQNYKWKPVETVVNWLIPRQHVLDSIERRWGASLSLPHQRLMRKLESFNFVADGMKDEVLSPLVKDYEAFQKSLPAPFKDERLFMNFQEGLGRRFLVRAKELGLYTGAIPEGKVKVSIDEAASKVFDEKTLAAYKDFKASYSAAMENMRQIAADRFGVKIEKLNNYFRHQVVSSERAYGRVISEFQKIADRIPEEMKKKQHRNLFKEDYRYRQLYLSLKSMYQLGGMRMPEGYGRAAISDAINQLEHLADSQIGGRMGPNIYSAYRRQGGMPELLRETDPIKVAESWVNNTLRAKFTRDDISEISKYIPVLEKLGASSDAAFIRDYVRNAMGQRQTGFGAANARMKRVRELAERYADTPEKWEQMVTVPEQVASITTRLLQANLLSSPFTALRNLEQIPFLTATEIGGAYGQRKAMEGMLEAGIDLWNRKGLHIDDLYYAGKVPDPRMKSQIHSEILRPKTKLDKVEKITDKYTRAMLWVFGKGETANRLITLGTARSLTRDLATGENIPDLMKFLGEIQSPSLRRNLQKKAEEVTRLRGRGATRQELTAAANDFKSDMEDYLLERTQFHYSRANISKAAEIMGPLLTTFTRYSTEVMGDIVSKLRDGKTQKALEKYLYPAVYMTMFLNGIQHATRKDERWRNRMDTIFGKRLITHVPAASGIGMFSLVDQPAPMLATARDLWKAGWSRDPKDISKAINDVANFAPLYVPVKNWVDGLGYRAINGGAPSEAPVASTFGELIRKPIVKAVERGE